MKLGANLARGFPGLRVPSSGLRSGHRVSDATLDFTLILSIVGRFYLSIALKSTIKTSFGEDRMHGWPSVALSAELFARFYFLLDRDT